MIWIHVNDHMQSQYSYQLVAPMGKDFADHFRPQLTPMEMLQAGVFGGKYMTDCKQEFPSNWFIGAKLAPNKADESLNYFGIHASQSLSQWRAKGWLYKDDPRGWFQWYCRYYMGRRLEQEDQRQIKRWQAFARHWKALLKNCPIDDPQCRPRQRQALLQWAYDSRPLIPIC